MIELHFKCSTIECKVSANDVTKREHKVEPVLCTETIHFISRDIKMFSTAI